MPSGLEEAHAGRIVGSLTTVDRLIIHGYLTSFWLPRGFLAFLLQQGLRPNDFGKYVQGATERLKAHIQAIAEKASRPLTWQPNVVHGKDRLAREIAERDGVQQGLICIFSTLETATCFALCGREIRRQIRKCLHYYIYLIDPDLGFMHVRIQSWFPFQIQIYLNGREWLSRQLDRRGVSYVRYENTFLSIDNLPLARRLCGSFGRRRWWRVFNAIARRYNPFVPLIKRLGFGSYHWVLDQCEVATDLMWKNRKTLLPVLDDLFDHAIRSFSARDVLRFWGRKRGPSRRELYTSYNRYPPGDAEAAQFHPEARRIKHRIGSNWIKMYDKWSVLRVETVINRPYHFKVLRFRTDRRGRRRGYWISMNKGIQNLWRYLEIGTAANKRYLDALAVVRPTQQSLDELDALCHSRTVQGRRLPKLNPVAPPECQLFQAVLSGEHCIQGFRNRNLRDLLYPRSAVSPEERRRRCARISRLIAKLRGHGLVAKVPATRLYRATPKGLRVMSAAIRFRHLEFRNAMAA